jgi:hypothetical protein
MAEGIMRDQKRRDRSPSSRGHSRKLLAGIHPV